MVSVAVEVLKVSDHKHSIKFSYRNPDERKTEVMGELKNAAIRHFLSFSTDSVKIFNNTTYTE